MKITVQGAIGAMVLAGMIGGGLLAFGFKVDTPADHIGEFHDHTETFEGHVAHFVEFQDAYVINEANKEASRSQRTEMVEAQVKLTCLRTGADTLVMLDMMDFCIELGVPRP